MLATEEGMLRVIALVLIVRVTSAGASTPSRVGGLATEVAPQYTIPQFRRMQRLESVSLAEVSRTACERASASHVRICALVRDFQFQESDLKMDFTEDQQLALTEPQVSLQRMYLQVQSFAAVMPLGKPVISSSAIERIYVITEKFRLKFVILHSVFV